MEASEQRLSNGIGGTSKIFTSNEINFHLLSIQMTHSDLIFELGILSIVSLHSPCYLKSSFGAMGRVWVLNSDLIQSQI